MAKSGCLVDLRSNLIQSLYQVKNLTPDQFEKAKRDIHDSIYQMMMNTNKREIIKSVDGLKPVDFANHSGGALGADITFDEIGNEFGFSRHNHYYAGAITKDNAPNGNVKVSASDFEQGRIEAAKAAKRNFGFDGDKMSDTRLVRNWSQVKYASSIYAISSIANTGEKLFPDQKNDDRIAIAPSVTGGTGYAVGMAINNKKAVYVFNQNASEKYPVGWYKYDYNSNDFQSTSTPILSKDYAGIGSRNLNDEAKQAIRDLYQNTVDYLNKDNDVESSEVESINIYSTDKNGFEALSNLYPRNFTFDGKEYHSVEHAYQTLKTGKFNKTVYDEYNRRYDNNEKLGKFTAGTKADSSISEKLMTDIIHSALEQNKEYRDLLLSTVKSELTHNEDNGIWKTLFPKILMNERNKFKNDKQYSGSGPKSWVNNENEQLLSNFGSVQNVSAFAANIRNITGNMKKRTDNEGYHKTLDSLIDTIQKVLNDGKFTKELQVEILKTNDKYSNARFIQGYDDVVSDEEDGFKYVSSSDKLEIRFADDMQQIPDTDNPNVMLDSYDNGLQGSRELVVHDLLHSMIDNAMNMNKELYSKASAVQKQFAKLITLDKMIESIKARSGHDATPGQIEQLKDIKRYINGSPIEFMMYALTNPIVYDILDKETQGKGVEYNLIEPGDRSLRDKRNPPSRFRKLIDSLVDIINNTYRKIVIGSKVDSDGKVVDKTGLDVLKDLVSVAMIKQTESYGMTKEEKIRHFGDSKYGDYNLGGKLNLTDKYKKYDEMLMKLKDNVFEKTMRTNDKLKITNKIEKFGSWMNKFQVIKDSREKGRFRLFSDVINTIVEDTTSKDGGAADFYQIIREIQGSRDRDKVAMVNTARDMLDAEWIDVPKNERNSITNILKSDWRASGLTIDELAEYLSDENKINDEINRLKSEIGVVEYNENAKYLGYYMIHGVSKAPELMKNAGMIVNRVYGSSYKKPLVAPNKVKDTIYNVDKLATFYALKYINQQDKDNIVKTLNENSELFEATSLLYYNYEDEQRSKFQAVGLDKFVSKGSVRKSSEVDMKFEVLPKDKVRKGKYTSHTEIRDENSILSLVFNKSKEYALVVSRDYESSRTQGGFDDIHIIDKELGVKKLIGDADNISSSMFSSVFKDISRKRSKDIPTFLSNETSDDINDIAMLDDQLIPTYDVNGNIVDYEVPISEETKRIYGRQIDDIANTVANTISHINLKENAISNNIKFAQMLVNESDANQGAEGYVLLRPSNKEEILNKRPYQYEQEWAMIPKYIQDAILNKDDNGVASREGLWVKEGRINNIIGYKDPSIANLKMFGMDLNDYPNARRAVQVVENYWKAISSRYKAIIVKYYPNVIIGNFTSNMWVAMRHGIGPMEYAKAFIRHWNHLTTYLETEDEIVRLSLSEKMGKDTRDRIDALKEAQKLNPFNLLIKDGQFSTIMEDIDVSGMTKKSHIEDHFDSLAGKFNRVGVETKEVIANIYGTRGSSVNKNIEKLTIYNDIINRGIILERLMQDLESVQFENESAKANKVQDLLNYADILFVNYGYRDNKYLKWANDTNLLMFTKYFFRALKANVAMMSRYPLASAGYESFDTFALDLSDSADQYFDIGNTVARKVFVNPVDMFIDSVTPHTAHTIGLI